MGLFNKIAKKPEAKKINTQDVIQEHIVASISRGYITTKQILDWDVVNNDDFIDALRTTYQSDMEKYLKMFPTATKSDQIRHWNNRIANMCDQIKQIRKQPEMDDAEKKTKILRRLQIILDDRDSLMRAIEYLKYRDSEIKKFTVKKSTKQR